MTENKATSSKNTSETPSWREIFRFAALAIIIVVPIRVFIAQPFIVSGESMVPTFSDKDYLIVDEISYRFHEPERGDVVIFRFPDNPKKFFIKRLIALPGETIHISGSEVTIINDAHPEGFVLDETYVVHVSKNDTNITVGEDEYFVMGDNRAHSLDSRAWGTVPEHYMVGRALVRLIPLSDIELFPGKHDY